MIEADHRGPVQAPSGKRYSVSPPDEHGNRFITVLADDGKPLPPNEPTEGA